MKIVHTSDWHVGKTLRNRSRHEEHQAVLSEIAGIVRDEGADVVIVAGDLFDSAAPSPEAERLVYKALLDLSSTGATVAVLAGNHDSERRLQAVQPLLELGSVVARPLPAADATLRIEARSGEVAMLGMLPWVGKHHVVRAEQLMELDGAQTQQEYWQRVAAMISRVCQPMGPDTVNLLAAHLTIVGADPGEEVRQAHLFDYAVPATVFPASLHYVALGHFHT
ncbi:MAG: metallophosphoesterase family protein, partial [Actinomycetota bacterium]